MPDDSGTLFVLATHPDPSHASLMPEPVQKHIRMEAVLVKGGMQVKPDHH